MRGGEGEVEVEGYVELVVLMAAAAEVLVLLLLLLVVVLVVVVDICSDPSGRSTLTRTCVPTRSLKYQECLEHISLTSTEVYGNLNPESCNESPRSPWGR